MALNSTFSLNLNPNDLRRGRGERPVRNCQQQMATQHGGNDETHRSPNAILNSVPRLAEHT